MLPDRPLSSGPAALKKRSRSQLALPVGDGSGSDLAPLGISSQQQMSNGGGGGGAAALGRMATPGSTAAALAGTRAAALLARLRQREFAVDWAVVVVALIVLAASDAAAPKPPFLLKAQLPDLAHPLLPNSVPSWSVPLLAVAAPIAVLAAQAAVLGRPSAELHKLILGLVMSVLVTGCITNIAKSAVGRPRPNFLARCWPDGKPAWRSEVEYGGVPDCRGGDAASVADGLKSFPSGHSSWSAAGLGYLSWALLDQLQPFDGSGHVWRAVLGYLPALGAVAVGVTRYVDWWHHPTDIATGLALGFLVSWVAHRCTGQQQQQQQLSQQRGPAAAAAGIGGEGLSNEIYMQQQPLLPRGPVSAAAAAVAQGAQGPNLLPV